MKVKVTDPRTRTGDHDDPVTASPADEPRLLAGLLDELHATLGRYIAFPTAAAHVAYTLWIAHTHVFTAFSSTPRIAFLSPLEGCGKTRALEIGEHLVPNPMNTHNATVAAVFRKIIDGVTLLMDEADAYFGPKAAGNYEELRALVNAGHRRGASAWRCVGPQQQVREFPAFSPVALAGLGALPATVMARSVVVRMRRRAPGEHIQPFRQDKDGPALEALRDRLAEWAEMAGDELRGVDPAMPDGVTDRPADVWAPLLAIADAAAGRWPARARDACRSMVLDDDPGETSLSVQLLADLRTIFDGADKLATEAILERLYKLDESPWASMPRTGKALDARGLARFLRPYGVRSRDVRVGETVAKGYRAEDLADPWSRYLPPDKSATSATSATSPPVAPGPQDSVADVADVADTSATQSAGDRPGNGHVADVADVAANPTGNGWWGCPDCGRQWRDRHDCPAGDCPSNRGAA